MNTIPIFWIHLLLPQFFDYEIFSFTKLVFSSPPTTNSIYVQNYLVLAWFLFPLHMLMDLLHIQITRTFIGIQNCPTMNSIRPYDLSILRCTHWNNRQVNIRQTLNNYILIIIYRFHAIIAVIIVVYFYSCRSSNDSILNFLLLFILLCILNLQII